MVILCHAAISVSVAHKCVLHLTIQQLQVTRDSQLGKIHFTASQCTGLGFEAKCAMVDTENEMSG